MDRTTREAGAALREAMSTVLDSPGWSVARLAREAGFERGRLYSWWRGDSRPTRASLERVARVLSLDPAVLLAAYGTPEDAFEAAPDSLADAITALTAELRESREDRKAMRDEIEGLKAIVGSLAAQLQLEQALTARLARHVQLETAGSPQ